MKNTRYPNIVEFEVYGDYALFSDPLRRVGGEKCSYQIPTYEAIKGVLSSVYWKPTFIWYIDAVRVMNPIQMETKGIRRINYQPDQGRKMDLSYYTYLKDCRYKVKAHFEWNENRPELKGDRNENKHHEIAKRMIQKGGRRDVFLGTRECQGYVEPTAFDADEGYYDKIDEIAFGTMYHGMTYADEAYNEETKGALTVNFWNPVMKNGIINFVKPKDCPHHKRIHDMKIKAFAEEKFNFIGIKEYDGEVM